MVAQAPSGNGYTPTASNGSKEAAPRVERPQLISSRRQLVKAGLAAGLCLCCPPPLAALAEESAAPAAAAAPVVAAPPPPQPWGYSCLTGPESWGGACATVGFQSPIALNFDASHPPPGDYALQPLLPKFPRYIKQGVTVKNTGHGTMMVGGDRRACCSPGPFRSLVLPCSPRLPSPTAPPPTPRTPLGAQVAMPEGVDYELAGQRHRLLQFHFHTPSEHTIDGRWLAMEAHLVHKNLETGNLAGGWGWGRRCRSQLPAAPGIQHRRCNVCGCSARQA